MFLDIIWKDHPYAQGNTFRHYRGSLHLPSYMACVEQTREDHSEGAFRMAFTDGVWMRQPLRGIFPADGSCPFLQVRPRLAQPWCRSGSFSRRVPAAAGHWRAHDRTRPVGMVFPPLVCTPGLSAADGRDDA